MGNNIIWSDSILIVSLRTKTLPIIGPSLAIHLIVRLLFLDSYIRFGSDLCAFGQPRMGLMQLVCLTFASPLVPPISRQAVSSTCVVAGRILMLCVVAYSFDDVSGDTSLNSFNINNAPSYLFEVINDIKSINTILKVHLVPWSPVCRVHSLQLKRLTVLR